MLMGGNAAGKTTTLRRIQEAHPGAGWEWWYPDNDQPPGIKSKLAQQFKILLRGWSSPYPGLALEGTRVYSQVFQCMVWSTTPRELYLGLLLQTGPDLVAHLRARCEKKGKKFREDYWVEGSGPQKADYEGRRRYWTATHNLLAAYPQIQDRVHLETFWVGRDYEGLADVEAWAAKVIAS